MERAEIIHEKITERKAIAFTFDDGPNPEYTEAFLDVFREVGGRATFYMIGERMRDHPELVRKVLAEGHEIGNHTYTHPNLTELTPEEAKREIGEAEAAIREATGRKPATFRPPYFGYNDTVAELCASEAYRVIGAANPGARDWETPGVEHILEHSRPHLRPGAVLLFHDGFGDRSQSLEAVRILAKEAADAGLELVTISELLEIEE
ncbi:polysaccharide deacetylase family protein [Paenibacillus sp. TRM 82003]|nr:polysaccharide deacetylase family protein [Paenibacillus sp. TRM 82003]